MHGKPKSKRSRQVGIKPVKLAKPLAPPSPEDVVFRIASEMARGMTDQALRWALAGSRGAEYRALMLEYRARREKDGAWSKVQAKKRRKEANRYVRELEATEGA